MKAMVLTGIRQMEMRQVADPVIQNDNDVLIKVTTVGVCGSDVHYYTTGRIGSQVVKYPFTVGHECAGTVVKIGSTVSHVAVGDRVAVDPAMSCWECDQCRAERFHTCRKLKFLGCPGQAEGCLSEYIVMPEESCLRIADTMSFDQATISEPLAIGVYGVRRSIPMPGAKIGILGAGPIGLSVLLAAKAYGAEKFYITDHIDSRLRLAKQMGAEWTGNPQTQNIVADINRLEPLQLDVVFECCGQQEALDQAIDLLKPGGRLMLIGIPELDRVSFCPDRMRRKEITLVNVRRQVECTPEALDLIQTRKVNVDPMVTHHFSFERTKDAFDMVADYRDGVVKAMITL